MILCFMVTKLKQLYHLLESNGVSSVFVDLEFLSSGHLRGVGIYKEMLVDILESINLDSNGKPIGSVIRFYSNYSIVHEIKL